MPHRRLILSFWFLPLWLGAQLAEVPEKLPSFPGEARDDAVAVFHEGKIYGGFGLGSSFGYLNDWWVFDTLSRNWEPLPDAPLAARQYVRSFKYRDKLYLFGGTNGGRAFAELWTYDFATGAWQALDSLPLTERWAGLALRIDDYAYFGLGRDFHKHYRDLWSLNLNTGHWKRCADFPAEGRANFAHFSLGHRLAVVGGSRDSAGVLRFYDDIWFYNPRLDRWEQGAKLPRASAYPYYSATYHGAITLGGFYQENGVNRSQASSIRFNRQGGFVEQGSIKGPWRRGGNLIYDGEDRLYVLWGLDSTFQRLNQFAFWRLDQKTEPSWTIYPNPLRGNWLWFQPEATGELRIYNTAGQQVWTHSVNEPALQILHLNRLPAGLYFCRFRDEVKRLLITN